MYPAAKRRIKHARLLGSFLALALLAGTVTAAVSTLSNSRSHAQAGDPIYCVTLYDGGGHPLQRVCVPSPFPLTVA